MLVNKFMKRGKRYWLPSILVSMWILFTVSLTTWWIIFGLEQIDRLLAIDHADTKMLVSHQKMILWEGGALFISLLGGAGALIYYMYREMKQTERLHTFLATFTHELRTPLTNLRLQAELLKEGMGEGTSSKAVDVLVSETGRLSLQLENCLFLADTSGIRYHYEFVSAEEALMALGELWPKVRVNIPVSFRVKVDRRAWQSILQNLIQNAVVHGKASQVTVRAQALSAGRVRVEVSDNGTGFQGNIKRLGRLFERFYPGSGSGIGIFLVRKLVSRMGGEFRVSGVSPHFVVEIDLQGEITRVTASTQEAHSL